MMKIIFFTILFIGLSFKSFAIIETEDIGTINPETVGVNTHDADTIPTDLWQGLSHQQVADLIKSLPTNFKNNFWARLQISFLLSPMKVPENKIGKDNIFNLRFEKLVAMGAFDPAYDLGKNNADQLDADAWAWCRFVHFLVHNNYEKAFKIAQEQALKDQHNKWQYAVITLQLLMGKSDQAALSLSLLEKENNQHDEKFIQDIKGIMAGKSVEMPKGLSRPLIIKLLLSKGTMPKNLDVELLPDDLISLIILDPGFDAFSGRMQLSILEYAVEQDKTKIPLLKKTYLKVASNESVQNMSKKIMDKDYPMENDPLIRASLYKLFSDAADEETKKAAFYAYYKNAFVNKALPVAVACFGKGYNYPAAAYDKDYSFAFVLHNLMLQNTSQMIAWIEGLTDAEMSDLALIILTNPNWEEIPETLKIKLVQAVQSSKMDPAKKFLFRDKLKFLDYKKVAAIKLSDSRLMDVITGQYGFGQGLAILLKASKTISETDIWQAGIHVRALKSLGLKSHVVTLLHPYAFPGVGE